MKKILPALVAFLVLLAIFVAACGGGDSDGKPGGSENLGPGSSQSKPGSGSSASGECEVNVTGDQQVSYKAQGGNTAVGADYWFVSEDELAKLKEPKYYLLIVNCLSGTGDNKNSLSFMPSPATTFKDLPFKPAEYVIPAGGLLGGAEKPGEMSVLLSVGKSVYKVAEPGKLSITKFDRSGIAGTFSFKAEEGLAEGTPKKISVSGKFDYACPSGPNCKK